MVFIRRLALICSTAALLLPVTGQAQPTMACTETDGIQIAALFDDWNIALKSGNAKTVAARYSSEATLLPTFSERMLNDDGQRIEYFKNFLKDKPQARIDNRTLHTGCNMAVDTGFYTFTFEHRPAVKARYTFNYTFIDDRWLITGHHSSTVPQVVNN
jgi:uncharacterized protein (TIGR02246 family)